MPHEIVTIFTLRAGRELHLETPDWYFNYEGNVSIKTPTSSHVIYSKDAKSNRPFTKDFLKRYYLSLDASADTENIPSTHLQIKPFGEATKTFEVVVTETAVDTYCTSYPPLTIVEDK